MNANEARGEVFAAAITKLTEIVNLGDEPMDGSTTSPISCGIERRRRARRRISATWSTRCATLSTR